MTLTREQILLLRKNPPRRRKLKEVSRPDREAALEAMDAVIQARALAIRQEKWAKDERRLPPYLTRREMDAIFGEVPPCP